MRYWFKCQLLNPGWQMGALVLFAGSVYGRGGGEGPPLSIVFLLVVSFALVQGGRVFRHYLFRGGEGVARPGLLASFKRDSAMGIIYDFRSFLSYVVWFVWFFLLFYGWFQAYGVEIWGAEWIVVRVTQFWECWGAEGDIAWMLAGITLSIGGVVILHFLYPVGVGCCPYVSTGGGVR